LTKSNDLKKCEEIYKNLAKYAFQDVSFVAHFLTFSSANLLLENFRPAKTGRKISNLTSKFYG
jgi:hypothetical protein